MQMSEMPGEGGMSSMNMSMMSIGWSTECVVFLFDVMHARTQRQFLLACFATFISCLLAQLLHLPLIKQALVGKNPYMVK